LRHGRNLGGLALFDGLSRLLVRTAHSTPLQVADIVTMSCLPLGCCVIETA
jgi:hypothetical protein